MKIIIDIDEENYKNIKEQVSKRDYPNMQIGRAICNGIPLPKCRGRLLILSEDAVKREQTSFGFSCQSWIGDAALSNATVAIVEADKDEHGICKGYYFGIDDVTHDFDVELRFTDWRKEK